jgi:intraflagellar transport protein 46
MNANMSDSDDEFTVESVRASLKKSSNDLFMAVNNILPIDQNDDEINDSKSVRNPEEGDLLEAMIEDLPNDIKDLFSHIDAYEPIEIELETNLKCFIPPYVPAVGEVFSGLEIPRPDAILDGIGTQVLDEIIPSEQSNRAVLELQLRKWSKGTKISGLQRSIANAASSTEEIDQWIRSVEEIHERSEPQVFQSHTETLRLKDMQPWPKAVIDELHASNLGIPSPEIDLSLSEYASVLCSLLGIRVCADEPLIKSVNTLFHLYLDLCDKERSMEHELLA